MDDEIKKGKRHIVGLVVFDGERFILLHRKLHWVGWEFPKGAIEDKETIEKTIERELFEETGIKKYKVTGKIDEFTYFDEKRKIDSHIQNYLVHVSSNSKVTLNNPHVLDEEIVVEHDDFKWFFPKDALKTITHKNQKESLRKAIAFLGLEV